MATAAVGSGNVTLAPTFTGGEVVSNAVLTGGGAIIGDGAMSAAYGGFVPLQYEVAAVFDFTAPKTGEKVNLDLLSDNFGTIGFDSLDLLVVSKNTGKSLASLSFTSSSAAKSFFNGGQVSVGWVGAGSQSIEIEYFLGYNIGTSAAPGNGFGFTYDLVDPPLTATVPEPSTWAMMLVGFSGLAFAGCRARGAAIKKTREMTEESGKPPAEAASVVQSGAKRALFAPQIGRRLATVCVGTNEGLHWEGKNS